MTTLFDDIEKDDIDLILEIDDRLSNMVKEIDDSIKKKEKTHIAVYKSSKRK